MRLEEQNHRQHDEEFRPDVLHAKKNREEGADLPASSKAKNEMEGESSATSSNSSSDSPSTDSGGGLQGLDLVIYDPHLATVLLPVITALLILGGLSYCLYELFSQPSPEAQSGPNVSPTVSTGASTTLQNQNQTESQNQNQNQNQSHEPRTHSFRNRGSLDLDTSRTAAAAASKELHNDKENSADNTSALSFGQG